MGNVLSHNETRGATDLAGKYRLIAELGQGGMASVYLAVAMGNSGFRKLAVVKLLRPEIAVDAEFVQMFLDEAKLCARLAHPNIVHTYDVGVDEVGHLMAMEYLDGVSLHAAVAKLARTPGTFTFPMQAKVLLEVLEGLRYAHELKDYDGRSLEIVHRDVTPHNIFVTYDGQVKLLDFGIAKAATSSVRTATGVIKGKLTYMAPEQARGENVDARADLYAVGVMLWEAVTGKRRWPAGLSQPALFTRLAAGEPPESPNAAAYGYPSAIDDIVLKAMAPKPDDRYTTAAEFRDALEAVVRGLPPVSLRDLGGILANAFADGRKRLRAVIEEQFRTIDAGGHPSAPHQLPAVVPPGSHTGSDVLEGLPRLEGVKDAPKEESQSRRITVSPPKRVLVMPWWGIRPGTAIVAASVIVAGSVALAFGGYRGRSGAASVDPAATTPVATREGHESAATAAPDPPATSPAHETHTRAEGRAEGVEGPAPAAAPASPAAPERFEPHHPLHGVAAPVAAPVAHPGVAHTAVAAPETTPVVAPPPPPVATAAQPPPDAIIRRPDGKPKVQLERDNPWP